MKRRNPVKTNPRIKALVKKLTLAAKVQKADIWKTVARTFDGPIQNWAEVNLDKLNELTKDNETVLVPGKVLGAGELKHPVSVYAFNFSTSAKKSVQAAKGKVGTIEELAEKNPKGTGVRIVR